MNKVRQFFISIGLWFKKVGIAIGRWFASWFVSVNDERPKFVSIGRWFASWFVSIDGKRAKFVSIGLWFASWFVSIDGERAKFVSIGLWFKNWFVTVDGKEAYFVRFGKWCKNIFVKDETGTRALTKMLKSSGGKSFVSSLMCIVIGLVVGFIVIVIVNAENAGTAIATILAGGFNAPVVLKGLGRTLADFAPLLLCGLSVVFAYKCGLFNIGAAGQYVAGIFMSYVGALAWHLPWYMCIVLAMAGGAILGSISGALKAYLGINEVISCIMLNWMVLYFANGILSTEGSVFYNINQSRCYEIAAVSPGSLIPTLGLDQLFGNYKYVGLAPILAIICAIIIWIVLNKTKFGFEIKATGANKHAAKYAGMNEKKNLVSTMAISGALAAAGAACYYLTGIEQYNPNISTVLPAMGFNGIAVGFLGALSPIGTIFSTLFITHITVGGGYLDNNFYSSQIADLVSSVIIYACAFALLFKNIITKLLKAKSDKNINNTGNSSGDNADSEDKKSELSTSSIEQATNTEGGVR